MVGRKNNVVVRAYMFGRFLFLFYAKPADTLLEDSD